MKYAMKKIFAVLLTVAMMVQLVPVFAATVAEGTNNKTIYFALDFYNEDENAQVTEVAANENFYVYVNFFGNPSVADDSVQAYNLLIGYDAAKVSFPFDDESFLGALHTPSQLTHNYGNGVALVQGLANGGIKKGFSIATSGTLFKLFLTATSNLTEADLRGISLVQSTGISGKEDTYVLDGNIPAGQFTVVQVPAIAVGDAAGNIYTDTTADEIKAMIPSFTMIDGSGQSTEYTQNDTQWSDLSVVLPSAGLVVGKNTLTASYNGYECEFEITVLDRVENIAVTTAPTKTTYTAFETFDKAGMVVTATYESGQTEDVTADCVVDTTTALKVADTSWEISYGDKKATQTITVNPKQIAVPVVSGNEVAYNGLEQEIAYSVAVDTEYVSVSGETSGKNAKSYTAVASLKDKANTVWATGAGNADVRLSWTIGKATIASGIAPMTKKYTATYAELPVEATVTGINENVSADITWYADAAWTQPASGNAQIAASYTGAGQTVNLYYVASGMDNYNDYKGSVTVSVTDKDAGTVTWTNVMNGWSYSNKTATGTYSENGYTISGDMFTVKDSRGNTLSGNKTVTITNASGDLANKITNVGTYTITVSYEDKDNKASDQFTAVVNPKSIEGFAVSLKIGDGNAVQTSNTNPLTCTYTGSEIAPVVAGVSGVAAGNYVVDNQAQGTTLSATNVSDAAYTIAVKGTGNYTGTAYGYWKITPAEIQISGAVVAEKVYNGSTDDADITSVTFSGADSLEKGVDYTVTSATYAGANAGESVPVTFAVALTNSQKAKNYTLTTTSGSANGRITQAAAPSLSAAAVQTLLSENVVAGAKDYPFDLARIVSGIPADAGSVTYGVKTEGTYVKKIGTGIDGSALKVQVAQPQQAGVTDSVVITVSSTNYMDADVTVNFEFKNKTSVTITLGNVTATYGDAYTVAGSYTNQPQSGYTWSYTYEGIEGTAYAASTEKPTKAGTYRVTAHYEDNTPDSLNPEIPGHIGEATATLTINKKDLTILAGDVAITKVYDGTTDAGALTGALALSGKVGNDEVSVDMTSKTVGAYPSANVGTYTVEIGGLKLGGADKDNYRISRTYAFAGAKITKQAQAALTINGGSENISKVYGDDAGAIVVAGGNGTGAVNLTSSDSSILSLTASGAGTWQATIRKVGTVTLTATKQGDNNYEAATALSISFVIAKKGIAESDFVIDTENKVYTNGAIRPGVSSQTLNALTDYDVVYSNNINVGTATITIAGKGNFEGEVSKTFTIVQKAFSDIEFAVSGLAAEYTYTGQSIVPVVNVRWGNILLVADTDYSVNYANNTNAGTATVTISGLGNYSGTLEKTFVIAKKGIAESDFTIDTENKVYTNGEIEPEVSSQTLNALTDYDVAYSNNINVGTATITITGKGNFKGEIRKTFAITQKALEDSEFAVSGLAAEYPYTGQGIAPVVEVKWGNILLVADTDYRVVYTNNINAGTATVTISGLGNYTGTLQKTFVIAKKGIAESDFVIDAENKVYTNGEIKPEVSSQTLNASTDYDVAYSNNINVGTATITITGKGNFEGGVSKTFTIVPRALSDAEFAVSGLAAEYTYTGQSIAPMVDVKWGNILLVADTDYSVHYADNTDAGTATVTISGQGNYSGSLAKTFVIKPAVYAGVVTITREDVTEGVQLTAQAPAGGTLSYQWMRDGAPIEGATQSTYLTTQLEDAGKQISVRVTSNGNYAGTIESAPINIDKAFLTGTVTLSGTTDLTATIADAPAEEHYDIVWLRDGEVIAGMTGTTYTVQDADKGCAITVKLVAKGDVYTGEVLSAPVSVPAEAPSFASAPTVTAGNGSLTVAFSAKANGSAITQYQILVGGSVVATLDGAQTSYTITNLVNGTQYTIKVVAINAIGSTESAEVTATPSAPQGGGGGGGGGGAAVPVQHQISTKTPVGGKVSISDKSATAGKVVTVTVTPDAGYEVAEVIVLDKNGKKVSVTKNGDVYTFTMPKGAITVDAEFKKVEEKPSEEPVIEFADVSPTAYYGDAVTWAVKNDVTKGTGANQFSPDAECTRAEMVTFLWRAAGSPKAKNAETKFTDMEQGSYYYDAVLWAVENGITTGVTETTFSPNARVNRAQTVTFLWRLANAPAVDGDSRFADVEDGAYYENAVEWAVSEKVTNGIAENSFGPENASTRAQIVTFLYRYFVK